MECLPSSFWPIEILFGKETTKIRNGLCKWGFFCIIWKTYFMQKILTILTFLFSIYASAQDTAKANASISNATVYFGYGAELTHQSKVIVSSRTKVIVINRISTNVDLNSLQISVPENVALLSHSYSIFQPQPPKIEKTPLIRLMEDSIQTLQENIGKIESLIAIQSEILKKTGTMLESTVTADNSKLITSAEVLKLVEYYNQKIEQTNTNIYNYQLSKGKSYKQIEEIRKRIADQGSNQPVKEKPYGQLVLQVISNQSGEIPVAVSYYTKNAGWIPVYDIRVNSKTNKVKLVYKASVSQTCGIDWNDTKLTLSTGTPNFGVMAPVLTPWYLQLYVPELYNSLSGRANGFSAAMNTIQSMNNDKALNEVIVKKESEYKFQNSFDSIDPSTLGMYTKLNEGQLNTNYEIELPYNIESDGKTKSISIKEEEISSTLKNYSVPKLDKEAYLMAEVADWQNLDLLPGDANIIMDNTYVGKSIIDPNSISDTLNLSLGRDKRLEVRRTLVKELGRLKTNGNYTKQSFTYEITVKNNKQTEINMLLKDQYPLSNIKEVEVELENSDDASVNNETGVMTWKLNLKPGESKKVRFSYSIRYPKDKKIINPK